MKEGTWPPGAAGTALTRLVCVESRLNGGWDWGLRLVWKLPDGQDKTEWQLGLGWQKRSKWSRGLLQGRCGEELSGASSTSTCQTRLWKMSLTNQFINNWGVEEPQKVFTSLPSDLNFENYLIDIYMENRSQTAFCKNKCCPLMQR